MEPSELLSSTGRMRLLRARAIVVFLSRVLQLSSLTCWSSADRFVYVIACLCPSSPCCVVLSYCWCWYWLENRLLCVLPSPLPFCSLGLLRHHLASTCHC